MKYTIDIPDNDVNKWIDGTPYGMRLSVPLSIENHRGKYRIKTNIPVENYSDIYQEKIEEEVWGFADYVYRMSPTERHLCFGFSYPSEVYMNLTFQEAKALFEKWMKSENEIHVGDEVTFEMAFGNGLDNNMKAVALNQTTTGEEWCVLTENGCIETHDEEDLYKTGRHFPEVAELLNKMRREEE